MSAIASVGNPSRAWSDMTPARTSGRAGRLFDKVGASGAADLQTLLDDPSTQDDSAASASAATAGTPTTDSLGQALQNLLPAPSSTVAFAQQRNGSDSDAGSALSQLIDQIAADLGTAAGAGTGTAAASDTATASATDGSSADAALFKALDTQGDGALSPAEFESALASAGTGGPSGDFAMPAPPPGLDGIGGALGAIGSDASTSSADGSSTTFGDLVSSLASALDNSRGGSLSPTQAEAFKSQFDAAIASLSAGGSSGDSSNGTSTSDASRQPMPDFSALADLALKQYSQAAASVPSPTSSFSLSA